MNGEAEVKYLDGDFRVVRPGAFVRCAVTGVPIPLEELNHPLARDFALRWNWPRPFDVRCFRCY